MKPSHYFLFSILFTALIALSIATTGNAAVTGGASAGPALPIREALYSEVSIDKNGNIIIGGTSVLQISGTNIFTYTTWGAAKIRWVITTSTSTEFTRRFGGATDITDITAGDRLNVEGTLYGLGGDSLVIKAKKIKNWSKENEPGEFTGIAANLNVEKRRLTIIVRNGLNVEAILAPGIYIKKGAREIELSELKNGDNILSTSGIYNAIDRIVTVDRMEIFQEQSIFTPRNFQGTLKSIAGTELPTSLVLIIGGKDYSVKLPQGTLVMNKARASAVLERFLIGDIVRVYGAIEKTDFSVIDAEIVRNISI